MLQIENKKSSSQDKYINYYSGMGKGEDQIWQKALYRQYICSNVLDLRDPRNPSVAACY